jgi:hypothetical protein
MKKLIIAAIVSHPNSIHSIASSWNDGWNDIPTILAAETRLKLPLSGILIDANLEGDSGANHVHCIISPIHGGRLELDAAEEK